ncbi:hypothetical protein HDU84_003329 [Entophlyctis sp. JEL0112]|nr:hypothetical protein HDU84_003329 [Entophlyctis sp. JEL0112]
MADVLGPHLFKLLQEKQYDKRKTAALDIERLVRDALGAGSYKRVDEIIRVVVYDFAYSTNANARSGGLIGLAAIAIALGSVELSRRLDVLVPPILACFSDPDVRVRYYACESMYNVVKVARRDVLVFFNEIFDAMSRLVADIDASVKNGAELLDRLIKDIVTEHATYYSAASYASGSAGDSSTESSKYPSEPAFPPAPGSVPLGPNASAVTFDFPRFIPLLSERIKSPNAFTRMFLLQWIVALDAIPFLELVAYLPEFLDGLFGYLSDSNMDIRTATSTVLGEFLKEIHDIIRVQKSKGVFTVIGKAYVPEGAKPIQQKRPSKVVIKDNRLLAPESRVPSFSEENEEIRRNPSTLSLSSSFYTKPSGSIITSLSTVSGVAAAPQPSAITPAGYVFGVNVLLDIGKTISILLPYLASTDEETQATALRWVHEFIAYMHPRIMVPFTPELIAAILPSLAHRIAPIRSIAVDANATLFRVVDEFAVLSGSGGSAPAVAVSKDSEGGTAGTSFLLDSFDVRTAVVAVTKQFLDENEETRIAGMDWLLLLHKKSPKKVVDAENVIFDALLRLLSDSSDEVVRRDLELLAQISASSSDEYFTRFLRSILDMFSADRQLLDSRGSLIIRHLCLSLNPERMFRAFAEILEKDGDLDFASTMVQNLNIILVTAPELADMRRRLKNLDSRVKKFRLLIPCKTNREYKRRTVFYFSLHCIAADLEISVQFLIQVDKLVQLIESPVFTYLRLQLLEPQTHPYLFKCLFGILMLLPQSSAFATLRNRLNSIGSVVALYGNGGPFASGAGSGSVNVKSRVKSTAAHELKWNDMLDHFRAVQTRQERYRRMINSSGSKRSSTALRKKPTGSAKVANVPQIQFQQASTSVEGGIADAKDPQLESESRAPVVGATDGGTIAGVQDGAESPVLAADNALTYHRPEKEDGTSEQPVNPSKQIADMQDSTTSLDVPVSDDGGTGAANEGGVPFGSRSASAALARFENVQNAGVAAAGINSLSSSFPAATGIPGGAGVAGTGSPGASGAPGSAGTPKKSSAGVPQPPPPPPRSAASLDERPIPANLPERITSATWLSLARDALYAVTIVVVVALLFVLGPFSSARSVTPTVDVHSFASSINTLSAAVAAMERQVADCTSVNAVNADIVDSLTKRLDALAQAVEALAVQKNSPHGDCVEGSCSTSGSKSGRAKNKGSHQQNGDNKSSNKQHRKKKEESEDAFKKAKKSFKRFMKETSRWAQDSWNSFAAHIAVFEDALEQLAVLGDIAQDARRADAKHPIGDEITRILRDQRSLEARFNEFSGDPPRLPNKTRFKENQLIGTEISNEAHHGKQHSTFVKSLKSHPNVGQNLLKIQNEQVNIQTLISKTIRDLRENRFNSLAVAVEEEKKKKSTLQHTINKYHIEREAAEHLRILQKEVTNERKLLEEEINDRNAVIQQLKDTIQEINRLTNSEQKYIKKETKAHEASVRQQCQIAENSLIEQKSKVLKSIQLESRAYEQIVDFLTRQRRNLETQIQEWMSKYEEDTEAKTAELENIKQRRTADLDKFEELVAAYEELEKVVEEDRQIKAREAEEKRILKEKIAAASRLQRWWRKTMAQRKAKVRPPVLLPRKRKAREERRQKGQERRRRQEEEVASCVVFMSKLPPAPAISPAPVPAPATPAPAPASTASEISAARPPKITKADLFAKHLLIDPTKTGLIPVSGTQIYLDRLKGWAELVKRLIVFFNGIFADEKRAAEVLQQRTQLFANPILLRGDPVFEADETMQKFVKSLVESQHRRAQALTASANAIANETLPSLKDLLAEISSKSMDSDAEWKELDRLLGSNRATFVKLSRALRSSIERMRILRGENPDSPVNKAKLAKIPKDVPKDPWIANLALQRFIHSLRDEFPKTLEALVNQQSRILVFEKVVIQLLKPTLHSYFARSNPSASVNSKNDYASAVLSALDALDPDKDWQLFLERNKTSLVDPNSLEKNLATVVVEREVKYEGMDHARCRFVREGTLLRNMPGILRSKGYKPCHYVLTVSGFLHGFADVKKDSVVEVGSTVDVGHFALGDPDFSLYLPDCLISLKGADGKEQKEFSIKATGGMFGNDKLTLKGETDEETTFWHDLVTSLAVTPPVITEPSPRPSVSSDTSPVTADPQSALIFENNEEVFDGHQSHRVSSTSELANGNVGYSEYGMNGVPDDESDEDLHPEVANSLRGRAPPADLAALKASIVGGSSTGTANAPSTTWGANGVTAAAALENAWGDDVNPTCSDNHHAHSLPPFANAKNKEIAKQIHEKESKLNKLVSVLDDNTSRADAMTGHLKNVQQELKQTQALHDAKTRQIETEDHFKQLADRESGRLVLEIRRIEKEITDVTDQLTTIQNNIYRGNERIESVRTELRMEKDELDEWLRVQNEKEEDNFALLKYTREDDMRIKELSLAIEKIVVEVNKKKALLSAEVTETQVSQIELDKTTESFKRLHLERQDLIQQWESAISTMQKRDSEIVQLQEKYQSTKEEIAEKGKIISEKQAFLDMQLSNNAETEKTIALFDRQVCKLRMDLSEATTSLSQFQDEVDMLKSNLSKTSTDLANTKSEVANLKMDLGEKQEALKKEMETRTSLKEKLARVSSDTISKEAKAAELQEILRSEEARNKELDREIKMLREQQFKRSQELFRLRQEEKTLSAEITGSEATLKNLGGTIHRLDQEALKQQTLLYAQEFQIQQLERKVRRAQGDRTDEEKEILLKRIDELNTQLEDLMKKYNLLNTQLKKSQEDLRQAKRKMDALAKEKNSIAQSIEELNLYTESAGNQLAMKTKEKEELMVEENILRLELRKLRGFLNVRADEVFTLENRQIQLQLALEERTKEISIHNDMLRVQVKNAEEERHSANSELRDRVGKVEKLRRRYEILMTQFAPEEGEEEHSQAFYVIKASQEREALQREGDELDAKIRKAEKEIRALENTLKLMNDRNEGYRMNLYKAELNATDVQHKENLEQQYRTVMEQYKVKRQDIQTIQTNLQALERTFNTVAADESSRLQAIHVIEAKLTSLDKEIREQEQKRDRAQKMVGKSAKEIRAAGTPAIDVEELDFKIRECKDIGNLVQTELSRVMEQHPEITMKVMDLYTEVIFTGPGVSGDNPIPPMPVTRASFAGGRSSLPAGVSPATHSRQATDRVSITQAERVGIPVSTTNINGDSPAFIRLTNEILAAVTLPPAPTASRQSVPSLPKKVVPSAKTSGSAAASKRTSVVDNFGPVTGEGRIKMPTRPGSAGSSNSFGSKRSG